MFTDGQTTTFTVTNGVDGENGNDGITPHIGTNGHWWIGQIDTGILASGETGEAGVGIESIEIASIEGNKTTYEIVFTDGQTTTFTVTNGVDGLSAYQIYLENYPTYQGSEEEWLDDLINGRLADKEIFTISFNLNSESGETLPDQEINWGEKVIKPSDPTRQGYEFDGWWLNGERWVFIGYPVTSDMVLTARWIEKEYTITLDLNGGSTVITTYRYSYNDPIEVIPNPTKLGYTFVAWYQDSNGIIAAILPNLMPMQNISLYAMWTINQYTISFESNGGTLISPITANYGTNILPPQNPIKSGYAFIGWFSDISLTQIISVPPQMPASNQTLYASWNSNITINYTIQFNSQGGTNVPKVKVVANGIITPPVVSKSGNTLIGWFTSSNNGVTFDRKWDFFSDRVNFEFTLFAIWSVNSYTIRFETNEGFLRLNSQVTYSRTMTYLFDAQLLQPEAIGKQGYEFGGWFSDELLTIPSSVPVNMPASNVVLYAKWIPNKYSLIFDTKGGSLVDTIYLDYGSPITSPSNPTKTGFTFLGWSYSDRGLFVEESSIRYVSFVTIPETMGAYDNTYYAVWKKNTYMISWQTNGGSDIQPSNIEFGNAITFPTPFKAGFALVGWYLDPELNTPFAKTEMPFNDLVLYAKWTDYAYTLSFETFGGTNISNIVADYNTEITLPSNPSKPGYVFKGWYTNELTFEIIEISNIMPPADITFYAYWTIAESQAVSVTERIASGNRHSLFVSSAGVRVYGKNNYGQLGDGTTTDRNSWTTVTFNNLSPSEIITKVTAGRDFSLALSNLGNVYSWGRNNNGQLGIGTTSSALLPQKINFTNLGEGEFITKIGAGHHHAFAVTNLNRVYGWGSNLYNEINSSVTISHRSPVNIFSTNSFNPTDPSEVIVVISGGQHYSTILTNHGRIYSWGRDYDGVQGSNFNNYFTPRRVSIPDLSNGEMIISIQSGVSHNIALTNFGSLYVWGRNTDGALGAGSSNSTIYYTPRKITLPDLNPDEKVVYAEAGYNFSVIITNQSRVFGWGNNLSNQLASLTTENIFTPTLIDVIGYYNSDEVLSEGLPRLYFAGEFHSVIVFNNGMITYQGAY